MLMHWLKLAWVWLRVRRVQRRLERLKQREREDARRRMRAKIRKMTPDQIADFWRRFDRIDAMIGEDCEGKCDDEA